MKLHVILYFFLSFPNPTSDWRHLPPFLIYGCLKLKNSKKSDTFFQIIMNLNQNPLSEGAKSLYRVEYRLILKERTVNQNSKWRPPKQLFLYMTVIRSFAIFLSISIVTGSSLAGQYAFPLCTGVNEAAVRAHLRGTAWEQAAHPSNAESLRRRFSLEQPLSLVTAAALVAAANLFGLTHSPGTTPNITCRSRLTRTTSLRVTWVTFTYYSPMTLLL